MQGRQLRGVRAVPPAGLAGRARLGEPAAVAQQLGQAAPGHAVPLFDLRLQEVQENQFTKFLFEVRLNALDKFLRLCDSVGVTLSLVQMTSFFCRG